MKQTYILLITLLTTLSCTNEMPFNLQDNPPTIIINAIFDNDKLANDIIVALTGREEPTFVNNANVAVYLNDSLQEVISQPVKEEGNIIPGTYRTGLRFSSGDVIRVVVNTKDNAHHAHAEVIVSHSLPIEKTDTITITKNKWGSDYKYLSTKTTFTDNQPQKNYYRILFECHAELELENHQTGDKTIKQVKIIPDLDITEDIVLTEGRPAGLHEDNLIEAVENKYGIFDNTLINGTYTMTANMEEIRENDFYFVSWNTLENRVTHIRPYVRIRLMSICQTQYLLLKALNIVASDQYDETLSHPLKYPSNVKGGTGIVGATTGTFVTFILPDIIPEYY